MSKHQAQFPFKRYGSMMLLVALGFGLYLSRTAAGCIKDGLTGLDLAQISETPRKDTFDPTRPPRATYSRSATEGTTFMGRMVDTFPTCISRSSFSEPRWARTVFLLFLSVGLIFVILDKLIRPKWKKEVHKRAAVRPSSEGDRRTKSQIRPAAPHVIDVDHLIDPPTRPRRPRRGTGHDPTDEE